MDKYWRKFLHFAGDVEPMNWHAAQSYCQSLHENTFLAEIYDEYSFRMISETLDTMILEFDWTKNWWLGGSDILTVS